MEADDRGEREASASLPGPLAASTSPMNGGSLPQVGNASSPVGPSWSMPSGSSHIWRSCSDLMVEHSPTAHSLSNPAPSDCPSDVFSWHDDASSSLATMSAADRTITVNTQRARMGEHLKGKLEGMIRQRFDNYLQIVHVLQNDKGRTAALECELRAPFAHGLSSDVPAWVSISCNEDGTFLVYTAPDVAAVPSPIAGTSSSLQEHPLGSDLQAEEEAPLTSAANTAASTPAGAELLRRWVEQVCAFGMSGRCHSLTALFHFGYTASKQLRSGGSEPPLAFFEASTGNVSPMNGHDPTISNRCLGNGVSATSTGRDVPSKITEEERPKEEPRDEYRTVPPRDDLAQAPLLESLGEEPKEPRPIGMLLKSAQLAVDCEQYYQALELCSEGLAMVCPQTADSLALNGAAAASGESSASSAAVSRPTSSFGSRHLETDAESAGYVQQFLLLRASAQSSLRHFDLALQDAEKLISLQPTCAEGYYWQSVALQGLDHGQEALEALMSALEYDPQNSMFQHVFTALFEEISASAGRFPEPAARPVLHGRRSSRGGQLGDALSTTTQATHLSSRSTTPTEVSAAPSRSSSQDSLYVIGETTEDPPA